MSGMTMKKVSIFNFPNVTGLEDVSAKLRRVKADSLFSAVQQAFNLRPIETEKEAREADRLLEYIDRAFEQDTPAEIDRYRNVLLILVQAFEDKHYIRAADGLDPADFIRLLLKEDSISQKDLVPDCFKSKSQISEFLHKRKGRTHILCPSNCFRPSLPCRSSQFRFLR